MKTLRTILATSFEDSYLIYSKPSQNVVCWKFNFDIPEDIRNLKKSESFTQVRFQKSSFKASFNDLQRTLWHFET